MTNQDGWKRVAVLVAGQVLKAQVLNAIFNKVNGTTGDHYPGDYAFVKDAKGNIVPATNTQQAGGYDAIFLRMTEAGTYKVLSPEQFVSNPRANKGRGRGANLLTESALADAVEKALSGIGTDVPTIPQAERKGKNGHASA